MSSVAQTNRTLIATDICRLEMDGYTRCLTSLARSKKLINLYLNETSVLVLKAL